MDITGEKLNELGLYYSSYNNYYHDNEDIAFKLPSKELFYMSCVDGSLELYRKVKDLEDLKEALWLGFKKK